MLSNPDNASAEDAAGTSNGQLPSTEQRDPAYFSYYAMLQHQVRVLQKGWCHLSDYFIRSDAFENMFNSKTCFKTRSGRQRIVRPSS